jgi:hypothetical protein
MFRIGDDKRIGTKIFTDRAIFISGVVSMSVRMPTTDTPAPSTSTDLLNREPCIFNAERTLDCGSIVTERNGRIIAKTSILPKP